MTEIDWFRYVTPSRGADFLLTKTAVKEPILSWTHYSQALRYAACKYNLILLDLPEVVNEATSEAVRRARTVYIVSTPERPSLALARQRCRELHQWGVDHSRIKLLLNRWHRSDIDPAAAEQITGCPVALVFPNDYRTVQRASKENGTIDKRSNLGEAYGVFSKMLMGIEMKMEKRSFIFRK